MIDVVAAALVRDGRVLATRRRMPAGGWEFPGGKIEPGEAADEALARELVEELALPAAVGERIGEADDGRIRIVLYAVRSDADPVLGADHDAIRWLGHGELASVDWLPIDAALLPAVQALLQRTVEG